MIFRRREFLKTSALAITGLTLPFPLSNCIRGSEQRLVDRALGCFMGAAIGDSLGGPVECQHYQRIRKYAGDFTDLLPFGKPLSVFDPPEDGWAQRRTPGTITDDTYIRMDLLRFYMATDPPYTAEKLTRFLFTNSTFFGWWEVPLAHLNRIKTGEFPALNAGQFMEIQGGGGGWWQPLAIMYAGNEVDACATTSELCSVWKTGLAQNILAAVVAGQSAAMKKDATIQSVVDTVLHFSAGKARKLFERAIDIAMDSGSDDELYTNLYAHASVSNDTHTGENNLLEGPLPPPENIRYTEDFCSSIAFAEQQPWALAYLVYGNGEPEKTLLTAVKGGRDADSIATNTASWLGALHGLSLWPKEWVEQVQKANIKDFDLFESGKQLAEKALAKDLMEI